MFLDSWFLISGTPWTEDEHRLFLTGLHRVGKGDWRGISRNFVKTRTPTQVASHAQKYFLRRTNQNRRRRRSSLFDITPNSQTEERTPLEGIPPVPPSPKMADLNLSHKTAAAEMFALSLKLPMQTSSSSSNEQKSRERSRPTVFETMSSNGDSIMGVAWCKNKKLCLVIIIIKSWLWLMWNWRRLYD